MDATVAKSQTVNRSHELHYIIVRILQYHRIQEIFFFFTEGDVHLPHQQLTEKVVHHRTNPLGQLEPFPLREK